MCQDSAHELGNQMGSSESFPCKQAHVKVEKANVNNQRKKKTSKWKDHDPFHENKPMQVSLFSLVLRERSASRCCVWTPRLVFKCQRHILGQKYWKHILAGHAKVTTNCLFWPSPRTWSSGYSPLSSYASSFLIWLVGSSFLKAVAAGVVRVAHGGTVIGNLIGFLQL